MTEVSDEKIVEWFAEEAQLGLGLVSQDQLDRGWYRLQGKLPDLRFTKHGVRRSSLRFRASLTLAGLAVATAVLVFVVGGYRPLSWQTESPLTFVGEGLAAPEGTLLVSPADGASRLLFSDHSRIELGVTTKISVSSLDARGARVGLVNGVVDVDVTHRARTSWDFAAGPFHVKVKGTAFRLEYSADRGRLTLQMKKGLVEVVAAPDRTIAVGAGESLELFAEPQLKEAVVAAPAIAPAAAPEASPPLAADELLSAMGRRVATHGTRLAEPSHKRSSLRVAARAVDSPSLSWSKLLAQGNFEAVVADAERRGIGESLAQASIADLAALADSARYTKRNELAGRALVALRNRFSNTDRGHDASFFLGRLAESSSGSAEGALRWYDTYLSESPHGPYASEALGREMTLLATRSPERARKLARVYLERFPRGSQTDLARSILESRSE